MLNASRDFCFPEYKAVVRHAILSALTDFSVSRRHHNLDFFLGVRLFFLFQFIHQILNDVLSCNNTYKYLIIIHHRDKFLTPAARDFMDLCRRYESEHPEEAWEGH